jgi:imidazole glycerol-phosphate synthase subunit HisH
MQRLAIIDFGAGNLRSIYNAFSQFADVTVTVTQSEDEIAGADSIVLPGVGAFDRAMANLVSTGLVETLREQVLEQRKKFLGICIGMQMLADYGYENDGSRGLGFISGEVKKIPNADGSLTLPHMGWNNIYTEAKDLREFDGDDFYFVHSYYFDVKAKLEAVAYCDYGVKIPCILKHENIVATQFHPEKSGLAGIKFLQYFLKL